MIIYILSIQIDFTVSEHLNSTKKDTEIIKQLKAISTNK